MRTFIFSLCSAVWMSLIYFLSSIPGEQLGPDTLVVILIKKSGHAVMFGILAAWYLYTLKGGKSLRDAPAVFYLLSWILTLLYAVSDEYHQSFTPGRHSSVKDVFIDVCGALTMLVILYGMKYKTTWKHQGDEYHGKTVDHR